MSVVVDLSAWQYQLKLADLPADVTGAIIKLSQDTFADGQGPLFRQQLRADPRFVTRGYYHFLGPSPVAQQVDFFASALGNLEPGESLWLDWENNAITGYHAPQSDAYDFLALAQSRWPGRVGWYSYRSNAITARQSGDFPLPLWLADPNPDGPFWADTLKATLRQWGQAAIAPINGALHNVDCNDILDPQTLASLGGDTMPTPQEIWDHPITADGVTAPAWQWLLWTHDEVNRPDLLQKRIVDGVGTASLPHVYNIAGTATPA